MFGAFWREHPGSPGVLVAGGVGCTCEGWECAAFAIAARLRVSMGTSSRSILVRPERRTRRRGGGCHLSRGLWWGSAGL